jgi:hypothetical protein
VVVLLKAANTYSVSIGLQAFRKTLEIQRIRYVFYSQGPQTEAGKQLLKMMIVLITTIFDYLIQARNIIFLNSGSNPAKNMEPSTLKKKKIDARCRWLIPIILADQETEISRITI